MPYPFALPTTSVLSFPQFYTCTSHPSLPHQATVTRGLVRAALKAYKRLAPDQKPSQLNTVRDALLDYLPYLHALSAGLSGDAVAGEEDVQVDLVHDIRVEWRPTLSAPTVPGREVSRARLHGLDAELAFAHHALALTYYLQARALQRSLYDRQMADGALDAEARTALIVPAVKALLEAHAVWTHLTTRPLTIPSAPADITPPTLTALAALALSEATSLSILKDDPLPAAVATARAAHDRTWLTGAPSIPHVRALLFARLSLAAADHASRGAGVLTVGAGSARVTPDLSRYAADVRRACRARACRFLGVDAEGAGRTGEAVAWVRAATAELGVADGGGSGVAARLRHEWVSRREDRRVAGAGDWGADGGRLDEARVLELLGEKWARLNATVNVQAVPAVGPLLAKLPSGREIHDVKRGWEVPGLGAGVLAGMRGDHPPRGSSGGGGVEGDGYPDSDDEDGGVAAPPGAFPSTQYF